MQRSFQLPVVLFYRTGADDDEAIIPWPQPAQLEAQYLAHSAFDAIAPGGPTDVTANGNGKSADRRRIRWLSVNEQHE